MSSIITCECTFKLIFSKIFDEYKRECCSKKYLLLSLRLGENFLRFVWNDSITK